MNRIFVVLFALGFSLLCAWSSPAIADGDMTATAGTIGAVDIQVAYDGTGMACHPQQIFCPRGTSYVCNRCVPVPQCKPQRIFCKIGSVYVCNSCVPKWQCKPQTILCPRGQVYICNQCVPK